jgi:hypothetical protein
VRKTYSKEKLSEENVKKDYHPLDDQPLKK